MKARIVIEDRARITRENAICAQEIARARGYEHVLIISRAGGRACVRPERPDGPDRCRCHVRREESRAAVLVAVLREPSPLVRVTRSPAGEYVQTAPFIAVTRSWPSIVAPPSVRLPSSSSPAVISRCAVLRVIRGNLSEPDRSRTNAASYERSHQIPPPRPGFRIDGFIPGCERVHARV